MAMTQFAASHVYSIGDLIRQRGNWATQTITTLTSVTTTATATVTGHGFITGQSVLISGATQPNYNKQTTITVVDANTFTYAITATTSPATGSPVVLDQVAAARAFRCTTAGTSAASEPVWATGKASTTTSNTAIFTEVTGNSLYNWSAPHAFFSTMCSYLTTQGDRGFISSDHNEVSTGSYNTGTLISDTLYISVNRAGSVPPTASDILSGATITACTIGTTNIIIGGNSAQRCLFQGITFQAGNGGSNTCGISCGNIQFCGYFRNCTFYVNTTNSSSGSSIAPNGGNEGFTIWENCSVKFGATGQSIHSDFARFLWFNTSSPVIGSNIPTALITSASGGGAVITLQGLDLSGLGSSSICGTTIYPLTLNLFNCRLSSNTVIYDGSVNDPGPIINLVNCDSSVGYRNELYQSNYTQTTSTSIIRSSGGASDGVQAIAWRIATLATLQPMFGRESQPIYKWNPTLSSLTATVEVISNVQLNNNNIWLEIEYLGSGSYPLSSFANNSIVTPLTTAAAVTSSTAAWNNVVIWNADDSTTITLTNSNLTATKSASAGGGVRSYTNTSSGLLYFEITDITTSPSWKCGLSNASHTLNASLGTTTNSVAYTPNTGVISINSSTLTTIQTATTSDVIGIAVDFTHSKIWIRKAAGNWNNDVIGNQNPATNTGGVSISTLAAGPYYITFGDTSNGSASATVNFGDTSFNTAAPSGFSAWNTIQNGQKLQVTFVPAMVGLVRAVVKVAKASAVIYVDPLLTLA